jgi:ABC-type antimicrobial peptide transport system permease subunit
MAMGAQRSSILGIVVGRAALLSLLGLLLGCGLAVVVARVLGSLVFGVGATDPWIFTGVALVLLAITTAGCLLPALRAVRLQPMSTLREE